MNAEIFVRLIAAGLLIGLYLWMGPIMFWTVTIASVAGIAWRLANERRKARAAFQVLVIDTIEGRISPLDYKAMLLSLMRQSTNRATALRMLQLMRDSLEIATKVGRRRCKARTRRPSTHPSRPRTTRDNAMEETLEQRTNALRFDVNRSVRYHNRRRAFYDRFNDFSTVCALVLGSATFFVLFKELEFSAAAKAVPAGLITIIASINLVMGSTRMARLHHDLAKRFIALESELSAMGSLDETGLAHLTAARLAIEQDEPPVLRVLDTLCYNDTLRAFGYARERFIHVRWYQRWAAQFFDIEQHKLGGAR